MSDVRVNPFPPKWNGIHRVKASPYYFKERWPEADFGDRWRALKARLRTAAPAQRPAPGGSN